MVDCVTHECVSTVYLRVFGALGLAQFLRILLISNITVDKMTDSTELTTRDVLHQVDRRLTRIEDDLRSLETKIDHGFDRLDTKIDTGIARSDDKFRWTYGLMFASWLSLMAAILLK